MYEHLTACFLSGLPCVYAGDKHLNCFYDYCTLYQFRVVLVSNFDLLYT